MADEERMEQENEDGYEEDGEGQLEEDEILKVIPLDEFLDSNGRAAFSDDEDDGEPHQVGEGDEEVTDDSVGTLQCHEKDVFVVATAGTRWMSSGGEDDRALLFDLEVSESEPSLEIKHTDSVTCLEFNKAESLLASGDMSGTIIITDLATNSTRVKLEDCTDLEWLFWHAGSDILFAGDDAGLIWMWLIGANGVAQSKIYTAGSGGRCTCGKLLSDGKRLLAGYDDGTARLWALKDQSHVSLRLSSEISSLDVHPTSGIAAIGTSKGDIFVVSTGTLEEPVLRQLSFLPSLHTQQPSETDEMEEESIDGSVETISFGPSYLAVGRNDGTTAVYPLDSPLPRFTHTNSSAQAVTRVLWTILPNGKQLLVTGSVDSFVRIFDGRDGSLLKELCCGGSEVLDLLVIQTDPVLRLLAACGQGAVRVLQME